MYIPVVFEAQKTCSMSGARRFNLHSDPAAIERIDVAVRHPPMRAFLANVNASDSIFSTFGCKAWSTTQAGSPQPHMFASRTDIIFLQETTNFGKGPHDGLARRLKELLEHETGETFQVELRISAIDFGEDEGFCLRVVLYARGTTPEQAEARWGLGLARLQQALLFVARELRHNVEPGNRTKNEERVSPRTNAGMPGM